MLFLVRTSASIHQNSRIQWPGPECRAITTEPKSDKQATVNLVIHIDRLGPSGSYRVNLVVLWQWKNCFTSVIPGTCLRQRIFQSALSVLPQGLFYLTLFKIIFTIAWYSTLNRSGFLTDMSSSQPNFIALPFHTKYMLKTAGTNSDSLEPDKSYVQRHE